MKVNKDTSGLDKIVKETNEALVNSNRYSCKNKRNGYDAYYLDDMKLFVDSYKTKSVR